MKTAHISVSNESSWTLISLWNATCDDSFCLDRMVVEKWQELAPIVQAEILAKLFDLEADIEGDGIRVVVTRRNSEPAAHKCCGRCRS